VTPKVVLITNHIWASQRRAGFHWIAAAFVEAGWDVTFVTTGMSLLGQWRGGDYRFSFPISEWANRRISLDGLTSYIWYTPWHPMSLRYQTLHALSWPMMSLYPHLASRELDAIAREADLFIFESCSGLLLYARFRRLNPNARFVYRMSDLLQSLYLHPIVTHTERQIIEKFDLVSVPSQSMLDRYAHHPNVKLHRHGIRADLFDREYPNPFAHAGPNVLFVGNSRLDRSFIAIASELYPDWYFHIIGPLSDLPQSSNIIAYGEMPFEDTIPYLKFADIGLQTLEHRDGADSFSDSLKVIQYTYCRLPIIAPDFIHSPRSHVIPYHPGNRESIERALENARHFDRTTINRDDIHTWNDFVEFLNI